MNGDKVPDQVSGNFWHEGPEYLKRHHITNVKRYGEYYDDFATILMDLNGDERLDFVTGGLVTRFCCTGKSCSGFLNACQAYCTPLSDTHISVGLTAQQSLLRWFEKVRSFFALNSPWLNVSIR